MLMLIRLSKFYRKKIKNNPRANNHYLTLEKEDRAYIQKYKNEDQVLE